MVAKATPVPAAPNGARPLGASRRRPSLRAVLNGPVIFSVVIVAFGPLTNNQNYLIQGATALTFAIAATGLGLALGLAGEFLLGQLALFATSAYVTASLTVVHSWNFWPAALMGLIAATLLGLVLSLVGLRISKFYFALVGFFLVYLIPNFVEAFSSQTAGTAGLSVLDYPRLFGSNLEYHGMYLLAAVALVVTLVLVRNVRSAPLGIHMRRMRDSPAAVAAMGVSPWRIRIVTYVLSSILAGVGGAIYSHITGFISPNNFDVTFTILLFAAVLVGGATTLLGPSLGIFLLYVIPTVVINVQSDSDLIYGAVVLISVILFRGGVEQAVVDLAKLLARRSANQRLRWTSRATGIAPGVAADAPRHETAHASVAELVEVLWALHDGIDVSRTLTIKGARKRYGTVAALDMEDGDDVVVEPGEVHLLLGPNGSGKTTLLNAISGYARLDGGTVLLGDVTVSGRSPSAIVRQGVGRSFQSPSLPDETTPIDLLAAALAQLRSVSYVHWITSDPVARRVRRESRQTAELIAGAASLGDAMHQPCSQLTSGQRRIVDVLLALTSRSSIVLLDEPAAGLSQDERGQLAEIVRGLAARGMAFIVVEHDLELALRIADKVTVLAEGHLLARGTPQDITSHPSVREVLIGAAA